MLNLSHKSLHNLYEVIGERILFRLRSELTEYFRNKVEMNSIVSIVTIYCKGYSSKT